MATVRRVVDSGIGTLHHGMCNHFPDVRISLTGDSDSLASDGGVHTEHLVARIFLMRTVCKVVLSGSHPSFILSPMHMHWLKGLTAQDGAVYIFHNSSHFAQHVVHHT